MKKRALLLGSSLLGLAVLAASAAVAADDVAIDDGAAAGAETAAPADEAGSKQRGLYVGGSAGLAVWEADGNSGLWDSGFVVDDTNSPNDLLWSVFAGYRLSDWLGAEVGWTDLGGFTAADHDAADPTDFNKTDITVDGLEARLRFWHSLGMDRLGLDGLTAIGGVGIFFYSSDTDSTCRIDGNKVNCPFGKLQPLRPSEDSGEALTVSLGLQYQVIDNLLLRTEYQRFFGVDRENVDTVSLSVVVGFYDLFGQAQGGGGDMGGIVVE